VSDVHIDLNGFTVERTGGGFAISAFGADRLQVRNGTLKGGGISAYACMDLLVTGLTISEPSGTGIDVGDSSVVISHNVVGGAGNHGIHVEASELVFVEATIVGNVIRDPASRGIYLMYPARTVVAENQVSKGLRGIEVYSGNGGDVYRNTIHDADYGIYVLGGSGVNLHRNTVRGCDSTGLYLEHSDHNHIEGNVLTGNVTGLHFDVHADDNVYRGNTVRGSTTADFMDSGLGNTSHGDNYMPNQM
jgi:parallel beta-helix repeat protein